MNKVNLTGPSYSCKGGGVISRKIGSAMHLSETLRKVGVNYPQINKLQMRNFQPNVTHVELHALYLTWNIFSYEFSDSYIYQVEVVADVRNPSPTIELSFSSLGARLRDVSDHSITTHICEIHGLSRGLYGNVYGKVSQNAT